MYLQVPSHAQTLRYRQRDTREEADLTEPESGANRPRTSSDELANKISACLLMLVFLAVPAHSRPTSETVFRHQKNPEQSFKPEMGRSTLGPPPSPGA